MPDGGRDKEYQPASVSLPAALVVPTGCGVVLTSYVAAAVNATDGNVRKAARLQISPSTLYRS